MNGHRPHGKTTPKVKWTMSTLPRPFVALTLDSPAHLTGNDVQGESRFFRGGPFGKCGRVLHPFGL